MLVALLAACAREPEGRRPSLGETPIEESGEPIDDLPPWLPATSSVSSSTHHDGDDSTDESSETTSAASSETTSGSESSDDTATALLPESCAHALLLDPNAATGIYEIAPPAATVPTPISVYCDMTALGGGWMLAARSSGALQSDPPFGWGVTRGSLSTPDEPYSVNALGTGVPFTELLIGDRGEGFAWGAHVYRVELPASFRSLTGTATRIPTITTLAGPCSAQAGFEYVRYIGYIERQDVFLFNNDGSNVDWLGLRSRAWSTYASNCVAGGLLHVNPGMIFVR